MAERKAVNKYYPPDWDPSKGSINQYHKQHPLRARARKLDQGILIIRFELPYSVWCLGCNNHVGTGVRFNAEKKRVGQYYSTPIFSFRMKCHLCTQWWEIRTDPKNAKYEMISGAKIKVEEWDPEENGTIKLLDDKERFELNQNKLKKLEHKISDENKAKGAAPMIEKLKDRSDQLWGDISSKNKMMRKKLREEKKVIKKEKQIDDEIIKRNSLHIKLLPPSIADEIQAKTIEFQPMILDQKQELNHKLSQPLFSKTGKSYTTLKSKKLVESLKERAQMNTRLNQDPFLQKKKIESRSGPLKSIKASKPDKKNESLVAYDDSESEDN